LDLALPLKDEMKSARWISPRISQRALFSLPDGSGHVRSISPRISNESIWLNQSGCLSLGAEAASEQDQNCMKIRVLEAF
jgi:hypothetical protein